MNEVFYKIIERLEKEMKSYEADHAWNYEKGLEYAKEIIQEVAEKYQKDNKDTITKLISGEWVDCDKVQQALGMSFKECFPLFDFSRTAEWWCLAGKTKEEKNRNGQKITTKFKLKSNNGEMIPCKERLPEPEQGRMTNADKIRSMTDEELAEYLDNMAVDCSTGCKCIYEECVYMDCRESIVEWLRKEVDE